MPTYNNYEGQLAARLDDFRARGQKEGSKNRPPPHAQAPDQNESELRAEGEKWLGNEQRIFDATLTEASKNATEARQKVIELQTSYEQLVREDSALAAVNAELAGDRPKLVRATAARLRAEADIRYFRAANDIHEEAVYPESRYLHFGFIAVLAILEVVVNAFFYENSQGLLGGVTVALGIAIINIALAVVLGAAFRYKNLAAPSLKARGWVCFALFVFVVILCNALFASFRSEYQVVVDPSEPAQVAAAFQRAWPDAWLIFKLEPRFQDHWSFILFGVGVILSIGAFFKGYTMDDKFPGYGPKDRAYRATVDEEHQQQQKARQKVKELLHHRKAAVQAALQEPLTQVAMLARRIADLGHARQTLDSQTAAIQRDHLLVAESYRHANLAVRAVTAPEYFGQKPVLSTAINGSAAEAVSADLSNVQNELKALGDKHRDSLNAKLKGLQEDTNSILTQSVVAYLADVRSEAEDEIASLSHTLHRPVAV